MPITGEKCYGMAAKQVYQSADGHEKLWQFDVETKKALARMGAHVTIAQNFPEPVSNISGSPK